MKQVTNQNKQAQEATDNLRKAAQDIEVDRRIGEIVKDIGKSLQEEWADGFLKGIITGAILGLCFGSLATWVYVSSVAQ